MVEPQESERSDRVVDQSGATAGSDIVGRDKFTIKLPAPKRLSKVEQLKARLLAEVSADERCEAIISELQRYKKKVPDDGVSGLEAKLEISGRSSQLMRALEMKETFAKLLEEWSLYASAQEIFAHLLAFADYRYNAQVLPRIGNLDSVSIDELIEAKILAPAIEEVGVDVFSLDHHSAMGMVYWLAEQCRVRWHE